MIPVIPVIWIQNRPQKSSRITESPP